jgi:hypothetical protein
VIRFLVLPALLLWVLAVHAAPADPFAFITQEVCVDGQDRPVTGDPVHCADKRRLRVGEAIPYRRVDAGNWQAFFAYPVQSPGGQPRAMVAKVFGGNDSSGSYGDLGVRSGYDLLEIDEGLVSGIRTSDQGAGDQIFWRTADCARTNGWIFFPVGLKPGEHGERRSTLKITKGPSIACPWLFLRSIAPDYTVWDRPAEPVRYTSGKLLDSIVSMHFAYGDPADPAHDNDSMEKFYFTKPYGYTRWEAWETPEGCRKRALRNGKDPAETCRPYPVERCNGANTATYFGKLYLRLDCRDVSFYVADTDRPFDPLVSDAAPGDILSRNLLRNPTFFDGAAEWTAEPAATLRREPRSNNAVLALPAGARLSQRFTVPSEIADHAKNAILRFGVTLKPDTAAGARAEVSLRLDDEDGPAAPIERAVEASGGSPRTERFEVPADAQGGRPVSGRIEVALDPRGGAALDDIYVTFVAREPPTP